MWQCHSLIIAGCVFTTGCSGSSLITLLLVAIVVTDLPKTERNFAIAALWHAINNTPRVNSAQTQWPDRTHLENHSWWPVTVGAQTVKGVAGLAYVSLIQADSEYTDWVYCSLANVLVRTWVRTNRHLRFLKCISELRETNPSGIV